MAPEQRLWLLIGVLGLMSFILLCTALLSDKIADLFVLKETGTCEGCTYCGKGRVGIIDIYQCEHGSKVTTIAFGSNYPIIIDPSKKTCDDWRKKVVDI